MNVSIFLLLQEQGEETTKWELKRERKFLRDHSNPLEMDDMVFQRNFRLSREAFRYVFDIIKNEFAPTYRTFSLTPFMKLCGVLRYLADGGYQFAIGKDFNVGIAQSTMSKVLWEVLEIMERKLCPILINFEMTDEEIRENKLNFFEKAGIPGVIGCVDGTHIAISSTSTTERHLFYNRKGYFSINAMLICDSRMRIIAISARHQGATHDSLIWNLSEAKKCLEDQYLNGVRGHWLLGDCGYPLQPWLITPLRNTTEGSRERIFNKKHSVTRNIVERTIGIWKNRFRCLLKKLKYDPAKVAKVINVCAALHNVCINFKVPIEALEPPVDNIYLENNVNEPQAESTSLSREAIKIRNDILNNL